MHVKLCDEKSTGRPIMLFFCEFDTQLQVLIEIVLKYCKSTNSGRKILLDCENCFLFSCLLYKMEARRRQFVFETSMNACNVMSSLGLFFYLAKNSVFCLARSEIPSDVAITMRQYGANFLFRFIYVSTTIY